MMDSQAAIKVAFHNAQARRSEFIDIRWTTICNTTFKRTFSSPNTTSHDMLADILTKAAKPKTFAKIHAQSLG